MSSIRFFQRTYHLWERIVREKKRFSDVRCNFGLNIAVHGFIDGIIPPGKSKHYISAVEKYVDHEMTDLVERYQNIDKLPEAEEVHLEKVPIWCCWWQGEAQMPELVKLCHTRLKQVIPREKAELHVITFDNYQEYVTIPVHIIEKFQAGIITMTTMSDVLRFRLLEKYGGYWMDATLFFTGNIPDAYFTKEFYCQRMAGDSEKVRREACKGNWCGFSMAGTPGNVVFRYMNDAFSLWWTKHNDIVDYVLIDYLLWTGYRKIPAIKAMINQVPDNNEDIFELYRVLNQPYSVELYQRITARNVMHKLTYKEKLVRITEDGQQTMYGWLWQKVFNGKENICNLV